MNEWATGLLGSGLVGTPILGLVLWGKLIPSWVVNKNTAALERQHAEAIESLDASHMRELDALRSSHADALALRDREASRLVEQVAYEREAKDIERGRSDAATERLGNLVGEYGAVGAKFARALEQAAQRDGDA